MAHVMKQGHMSVLFIIYKAVSYFSLLLFFSSHGHPGAYPVDDLRVEQYPKSAPCVLFISFLTIPFPLLLCSNGIVPATQTMLSQRMIPSPVNVRHHIMSVIC